MDEIYQSLLLSSAAKTPRGKHESLLQVLKRLGLTANLQLCLDASDPNSYPGSGQTWADVSGNGHDFHLGADGDATTTDPTWVDDGRASYFSFDGGDRFVLKTANPAWVNAIHKEDGKISIVCALNPAIDASSQGIVGTHNGASPVGFDFRLASAGLPQFVIANGSGNSLDSPGSGNLTAGAWSVLGVSFDEAVGSGGLKWNINGVPDTDDSAVTSPSASDAANTLAVGALGSAGAGPARPGTRLNCIAIWDEALSAEALAAIFNATRGRFHI